MQPRDLVRADSSRAIWILEKAKRLQRLIETSLGSSFPTESFAELSQLKKGLNNYSKSQPRPGLLVCDAEFEGSHIAEHLKTCACPRPPVLVISRCNDVSVISKCLEAGVAYLLVPVHPNLLHAKVTTLIKSGPRIQFENMTDLQLTIFSLTVSNKQGTSLKLTLKEFQILSYLMEVYPEGVTPALIRINVWGPLKVVPKALDVHLFSLRKKLGSLGWGVQFTREDEYVLVKT